MPITATREDLDERRARRRGIKAQVHVLTHTLHYGMGVFEGIRAYETSDGPAVFRLTEHIERLFSTRPRILGMEIPYTVDELIAATKETVAATGFVVVLHPTHRLLRVRRDGPQHACRVRSTSRSPAGRGVPTWVTTR